MMKKLFVEDLEPANKRVLIRVDFNVPLDETGQITDDTRICASLATIRYILDLGAKVILMSHLGRPKGKVVPSLTLMPVAERLSELLNLEVQFVKDCIGEEVEAKANALKPGEVLLLENLRFYKEETDGDEEFSKSLAKLADIYVNDAFGTSHRAHASMVGITKFIDICAAGYLLQKEIEHLGQAINNPQKPFVAILGGAKVSDKIGVIENLLNKADVILIGGAMAYTFLKAKGISIGSSRIEEDKIDLAKSLLKKAIDLGKQFLLPVDHIIAEQFDEQSSSKTTDNENIPDGWMGLDIGPRSIENYTTAIKSAKTIIWNGPMGVFEWESFSEGTRQVAKSVADSNAVSIIGGGDSVAAINQCHLADKVTHVSTGGGASLEMLEGKILPGIDALTNYEGVVSKH